MSYQSECERSIRQYYENCPADIGTLRSAYADAAHLCDAIAKDIVASGRKGRRAPPKAIQDLANAITEAGNQIYALRDKITPPQGDDK